MRCGPLTEPCAVAHGPSKAELLAAAGGAQSAAGPLHFSGYDNCARAEAAAWVRPGTAEAALGAPARPRLGDARPSTADGAAAGGGSVGWAARAGRFSLEKHRDHLGFPGGASAFGPPSVPQPAHVVRARQLEFGQRMGLPTLALGSHESEYAGKRWPDIARRGRAASAGSLRPSGRA